MAKLLPLSLFLCFLLFGCSLALRDQAQQNECQLERLSALEPDNRIESEGGLIETWNPNNKQFRCAGVALSRCTLQRNALRRPFYSNAPQEIFIQQGSGFFGMIFPGCPNTYEEPQESEQGQGRRFRDSHQKVQRFREGDVIAVPTGVVFWMFNDQENEVIAVSLLDSSSLQNQLDQIPRRFYLAGNQEQEFLQYQQHQQQGRRGEQEEEQEKEGGNIFSGFKREFLQDVLNVDRQVVDKLQGNNEKKERGAIVRVRGSLSVISPPRQPRGQRQEEEEEEEERQPRHHRRGRQEEEEEERQPRHQGRGRQEEEEERQQPRGQRQEEERQPRHQGRGRQEEEEERQPRHQGRGRQEEEEERQPRQRGSRSEEVEEEWEYSSRHSSRSPSRRGGSRSQRDNGIEETICTARLRHNIGTSSSPDIYNPRAGRITTVNSLDFPLLRWLKLSAEHGSLHKNAMFVPHYNVNANSILYALRGRAWIQVVNCTGNAVFDGELEAGRVLIVPQNFAVAGKSLSDRFSYVAFKTDDRAMINRLVGTSSSLSGLPEEVLASTFNLERKQARQLKNNMQYQFLVPPRESQNIAAA